MEDIDIPSVKKGVEQERDGTGDNPGRNCQQGKTSSNEYF